jgi:hypothetical protein
MVIYSKHQRQRSSNEAKSQLQEAANVSGVGHHDIRNNGDRVPGDVDAQYGQVICPAKDDHRFSRLKSQ